MNPLPLPIRDTESGATFEVRAHPGAKKSAITGLHGAALKVSLTTPPVEGRANDALIAFLADLLGVSRASITIASGRSSRNKVIRVANHTAASLHPLLAIHLPR